MADMSIVLDDYHTGDFVWVHKDDLTDPTVAAIDITDYALPQWIEQKAEFLLGSIRFSEGGHYVFARFTKHNDIEMAVYTGQLVDKQPLIAKLTNV